MTENRPGRESITPEGLEDLERELEELEGPARARMAERIKAARELGDLKENAEYHIAKEDQAHLETKIKRLRERRDNAVVVESGGESEVFAFGTTAEVVETATGRMHTWTLVGSTEANLSEGRLSAESPVGQALRDTPVGQSVTLETPKGERVYKVTKLVH